MVVAVRTGGMLHCGMNKSFRMLLIGLSMGLCCCTSREPTWVVEPAPKGTVLVLGTVKTPGLVTWHSGLTLKECQVKSGGTVLFSNLGRSRIVSPYIDKDHVKMHERTVGHREDTAKIHIPDGSVIIVPEMTITF